MAEIATALGDVDLSSGQAPSAETLAKLQELGQTFESAEVPARLTTEPDRLGRRRTAAPAG